MDDFVQHALHLMATYHNVTFVVVFVVAFGESFAFLSLLFPGTALLISAGTLLSSGALPYTPVLIGAIAGAVLGDAVSYSIGRRFGANITRVWPFSRNPDLLPNGIRFFRRHGGKSVFIGRFFGPMRAVAPLAAGVLKMERGSFWLANVTSALVWAPMLLFVGNVIGEAGKWLIGSTPGALLVFGSLIIFGGAVAFWTLVRYGRSRQP